MRIPKKGPRVENLRTEWLSLGDSAEGEKVRQLVARANDDGWNWEECGYHVSGIGLSAEEFWGLVKLSRQSDRQAIPLKDRQGRAFSYRLPARAQRLLHLIDRSLGGPLEAAFPQIDTDADRQRYLITSLTEEAIASSQLEGAAVTREIAGEMLRSGRPPRDEGEQMIANNYRTIQMLRDQKNQPLTIPLLHEIQSELTAKAIRKPDARGRFRLADEDVKVWDEEDQQPLHVPPPAEELPARVELLCRFANAPGANAPGSPGVTASEQGGFLHPAVRAIVLHFWLAYDHPYYDGNGRTARALFYWSMLGSGYWLVEYLTISAIIRTQPKQYARAFLNTEIDDNDLTYFILYHLEVIERSIRAFREYLDRKLAERKQKAEVVLSARFNERQQALLIKALKDPDTRFTYTSHARSHGVTLATARSDLMDLESRKLLRGNRSGRRFEFVAMPDLEKRLRRMRKE